MDAFDIISAEFAETTEAPSTQVEMSLQGRQAISRTASKVSGPDAHKSEEFAETNDPLTPPSGVSLQERQAVLEAIAEDDLPDAHNFASANGQTRPDRDKPRRRRQAKSSTLPPGGLPVGEQSDGHASAVSQFSNVIGGDDSAQRSREPHRGHSPVVAEIQQLWRMRQRWHRAEKSLVLQGKAVCRSWTAGDKDAANALYTEAAKGGGDATLQMALLPFLSATERFAQERAAIEKRLRKLAQHLPVAVWVAEIKGFGTLNLAAIVGEAGDLAGYRNPSCLWKRMGLAVIDGGRQRRVSEADAAAAHGYSPQRRCVAYLLGDTLIKAGDGCRYRPVYAERKALEAERVATAAHAHNRAARYMVKRVLRDLWAEARRVQKDAE